MTGLVRMISGALVLTVFQSLFIASQMDGKQAGCRLRCELADAQQDPTAASAQQNPASAPHDSSSSIDRSIQGSVALLYCAGCAQNGSCGSSIRWFTMPSVAL
jgi:hypothetical protein